jgi:pimeloyl-ACP methyl ester carboxylesterase
MIQKFKKQNLILIHSFPMNCTALKGFYEFMDDHFNFKVYSIDLPGFTKDIKPLENVNLYNYAEYVKEKIKNLGLDDYWLGGISFGFMVISLIGKQEGCKGIVAVEPYVGSKYLKFSFYKKIISYLLIKVIIFLEIYNYIWENKLFQRYLYLKFHQEDYFNKEVDSKTFFKTINILLGKSIKNFIDLPHVLYINKDDNTIKSEDVADKLTKNIDKLLIANVTSDHHPKTITKEYFEEHITQECTNSVINFVNQF